MSLNTHDDDAEPKAVPEPVHEDWATEVGGMLAPWPSDLYDDDSNDGWTLVGRSKNDSARRNNYNSPSPLPSPVLPSNSKKNPNARVIPNRIFVGGIENSTNEAELHNLFSQYGKVIQTKIIWHFGTARYAFITFARTVDAERLHTIGKIASGNHVYKIGQAYESQYNKPNRVAGAAGGGAAAAAPAASTSQAGQAQAAAQPAAANREPTNGIEMQLASGDKYYETQGSSSELAQLLGAPEFVPRNRSQSSPPATNNNNSWGSFNFLPPIETSSTEPITVYVPQQTNGPASTASWNRNSGNNCKRRNRSNVYKNILLTPKPKLQ